ncbi:MAG: hypothetical protein U5K56_13085 [Halioglobus sp.]|nr:hypothetical protein [Halioglobus sp.]
MAAAAGVLLLQACATSQDSEAPPDWVLNPVGQGIAATGCASWSDAMNIDRQAAMANARVALAQQIEVNVSAVDKLIAEKSGGAVTRNTFESISEQRTDQVLRSASATRVEIVEFGGQKQLCAQVELGEAATQDLFQNLVSTSPVQLSAEEEAELYMAFTSTG